MCYNIKIVNPQDVRYIQFPEWHLEKSISKNSNSIIKKDGGWDEVDSSVKVFYSGKYEANNSRKFIPIDNYVLYTSFIDRYKKGYLWRDTDLYGWFLNMINSGLYVSRYTSKKELNERLLYMDKLYEKYYKNGSLIQQYYYSLLEYYRYNDKSNMFPIVNIGRNGWCALEDGRHRLCIAKVANINSIVVRVLVKYETT